MKNKRNYSNLKYYRTSEAAAILGIDIDKLRTYVKKHKVAKKIGGRYRIPSSFVEEAKEISKSMARKCANNIGTVKAPAKSTTKRSRDKEASEEISNFIHEGNVYKKESREIAKSFNKNGVESLKKIQEISESFHQAQKKQKMKKERMAASEVLAIIEIGGLQSMQGNRPWKKFGIKFFDVKERLGEALEKLSKEELLVVAKMLSIGISGKKTRKSIAEQIAHESFIRASTR